MGVHQGLGQVRARISFQPASLGAARQLGNESQSLWQCVCMLVLCLWAEIAAHVQGPGQAQRASASSQLA